MESMQDVEFEVAQRALERRISSLKALKCVVMEELERLCVEESLLRRKIESAGVREESESEETMRVSEEELIDLFERELLSRESG